jgi:DNA uptake protein ComE-like DNA-binding protein
MPDLPKLAKPLRPCPYAHRPRAVCGLALAILLAAVPCISAQSINDQPPAHIAPAPALKVDINRASILQLMKVHGITQSYAQRIIAGRPYNNKGQLKINGILPPQVYETAKDHLIAHHIK